MEYFNGKVVVLVDLDTFEFQIVLEVLRKSWFGMKVDSIYEKGSSASNDDVLLITKRMFGVFDGAFDMERYQDEKGRTGATLAASIARDTFAENSRSLVDIAKEANSRIRKSMLEKGIDVSRKASRWSTTAAVVRLNKDSFDWLQISDSLILVIYADHSFKLMDDDYDHDEETTLMWKQLAEQKVEDIPKALHGQILKVRNQMNITYGVLNGKEEMVKFLRHGQVSLHNIAHVLLFTDGLFIPKEDPKQKDDFETLVSLFLQGGLKRVRGHIRARETTDPKCWKYPRFKQYDDIAAVSLSFV